MFHWINGRALTLEIDIGTKNSGKNILCAFTVLAEEMILNEMVTKLIMVTAKIQIDKKKRSFSNNSGRCIPFPSKTMKELANK